MDHLTKEQRSKNMSAIKNHATKIEIKLTKALWHKGYRYRKNCKDIFGKPDIVFRKYKIAIFCDSEFWHGKNWNRNKKLIHSNKKFWYKKIESNMKRDMFVNKQLKYNGWKVLRFWGKNIEKNTVICIKTIEKTIKSKII